MSQLDGFDDLMTRSDSAMLIVTTTDGRERAGCLVGFHSQSGIEPSSLCVWLSKANHTFRVAVFAPTLAVHFPTVDDTDVAETFGTLTGDHDDKFARWPWTPGPDGVPLLDRCPNRVIGRKAAVLDTRSDHVCFVLDPVESQFPDRRPPLRLSHVLHLQPGHEAEERPKPETTKADPPT
jgi:flavin reductase (DIM6/NTAB) family NADH-FMN oxidoreductase RutF